MPGISVDLKNGNLQDKHLQSTRLGMPVIGMESEFNVWLDEAEIDPKPFWKHPGAFIDRPLLPREKTSLQLPTGGAVYFDRGVIEVVTPVIELAPHCTARVVRNLWEQIAFVRDQLTRWGKETGHSVRLKAYSTHYNISYEIPESEQTPERNEKALALLLAYILPVPVMVAGANRRSTGVGVRPRGSRIEVTVDFTPDPGLMIATATLIAGIVRAVMTWPSYELSMLQTMRVPVVDGVIPGKHTTRKGWLTKDFHYPHSPYTSDIDAPIWTTQFGDVRSLRKLARDVAWQFRYSIRKYSDPFSFRLLFALLEGRAPSMLELADRPAAYEDVGNLCRWGMVLDELSHFGLSAPAASAIEEYVVERCRVREEHLRDLATIQSASRPARIQAPRDPLGLKGELPRVTVSPPPARAASRRRPVRRPRSGATPSLLAGPYLERRGTSLLPPAGRSRDRRKRKDRRRQAFAIPFPDRRLTRSAYEQVFLKIVSGGHLRMDGDTYTPIGMKGWYHALFRRDSDGSEKLVSIDELLGKMQDWV
jgi:hypothetical protein